MKVLFTYRYLTVGGVETVLRGRMEHLEECGVEAHLWFLEDYGGGSLFARWPGRLHLGDLQAYAAHIADGGYDVVTTIDTPEVLAVLARAGHARVVAEAHSAYLGSSTYLQELPEGLVQAVFTPSARQARSVTAAMAQPLPVRIVANPVHDSFLAPPQAPSKPPSRPILAWVGRLDEHKNWRLGLDVFRQVREGASMEAELWVVGHSVEVGGDAVLRQQARGLGVLNRLRWFSGLPHERMPALFDLVRASGGVALTTSRGESFGMTVVEAMARSCPVLVPAEGPYDEYVEDGVSGLTYAPSDAGAAAAAARRLLTDDGLRVAVGEAGRRTVEDRYSAATVVRSLASELLAVAGRG